MGKGKDLKPRKKRKYKPRNAFITVNGKKRFVCKNCGMVDEKNTYINKHSGSRPYPACAKCLRKSYAKYNAKPGQRKKRGELSLEERLRLRKADMDRRIRNNSAEKQRKRDNTSRKVLGNRYIKFLIWQRLGLRSYEIPPPLIETYRALVKIKRIKYKRI